jgi:Pyruvate/2-oxoacid:ferredoxin oxidoreductase gamma subunit
MDTPRTERSIGELIGDLSHQLGDLIQQEVRLAKVELGTKLAEAGKHASMIAAAALFGLTAIIAVAAAIALLLIEMGVEPWLSAVMTAALMGLTAFVLAQSGLKALRKTSIAPVETIHSLKETTQWLSKGTR